jgi:hypothetical protein
MSEKFLSLIFMHLDIGCYLLSLISFKTFFLVSCKFCVLFLVCLYLENVILVSNS